MRRLFPIFTLLVGAFLMAAPAQAQQNCAPRQQVIERLAERYGETPRGVGLGNRNSMVEIYASDATGTWSIVVTSARGLSCLVASGQAWEVIAPVAAPEGGEL
jgi:hypothetical protein